VGKEQEGATERLLQEIQRLVKGAGREAGATLARACGGGAGPSIELAALEAMVAASEPAPRRGSCTGAPAPGARSVSSSP
jgi:hypothetical protein